MPGRNHDEEHDAIFRRINELETKIDSTNGYLRGVVESNTELIKLLKRALHVLAGIAFVCVVACLFALIYGAIGKEGLHSVRKAMPATAYAIPAHNDFDKWRSNNQSRHKC